MPYPNISMSSDLTDGSTTVTADGGNSIAIKGSSFSRSTGDEPGTVGGVKSNVNMKASKWILYSFDVKIDGANACRLTDKKTQNDENAMDATGLVQAPVIVDPNTCNELSGGLGVVMAGLPPSRTRGATIAVGAHNPGAGAAGSIVGGGSSISGSTVLKVKGGKYAVFSEGIKQGEDSNVTKCGGGKYEHTQNTARPKEGHAEAKIIESLFKKMANPLTGRPTGTLTLKIGGAQTAPCDDCQKLIDSINTGPDGKPCEDFQIKVCP
jgi:hypothetical protein